MKRLSTLAALLVALALSSCSIHRPVNRCGRLECQSWEYCRSWPRSECAELPWPPEHQ